MDKQFELATLEDSDLSGVRGGCDPYGGYGDPYGGYGFGGGYGGSAGENNFGVGGLIGVGDIDLNVLGIAHQ